jgi:hypothetical protein
MPLLLLLALSVVAAFAVGFAIIAIAGLVGAIFDVISVVISYPRHRRAEARLKTMRRHISIAQ